MLLLSRRNFRLRNYAEVSTQLHGAVGVVEEFQVYKNIPQIRELMARSLSLSLSLSNETMLLLQVTVNPN